MWSLGEEQEFRGDLIDAVIAYANSSDGILSRDDLENFSYAGKDIGVIDVQGGIWSPGASWHLMSHYEQRFPSIQLFPVRMLTKS